MGRSTVFPHTASATRLRVVNLTKLSSGQVLAVMPAGATLASIPPLRVISLVLPPLWASVQDEVSDAIQTLEHRVFGKHFAILTGNLSLEDNTRNRCAMS